MASSKATTTVEVSERDMTREEYTVALGASMHREGWLGPQELVARAGPDLVQELADELLDFAGHYEVGAVLGVRLDEVYAR
jgi:hypothetical protein